MQLHIIHRASISHTAYETINYLKEVQISLMSPRPHSPDLVQNNFFWFPFIKNRMRALI